MTSGYHCSKISGSKQSFLTETAIWIVERWKKSLGYRFVPECNHAQEYMSTFSLFSVISAGLGFVEIQKPWQPRQRDVTTSPLLSRFSAKMHSQPPSLRVWECAHLSPLHAQKSSGSRLAKMTLMVHACAVLSIEKISFS